MWLKCYSEQLVHCVSSLINIFNRGKQFTLQKSITMEIYEAYMYWQRKKQSSGGYFIIAAWCSCQGRVRNLSKITCSSHQFCEAPRDPRCPFWQARLCFLVIPMHRPHPSLKLSMHNFKHPKLITRVCLKKITEKSIKQKVCDWDRITNLNQYKLMTKRYKIDWNISRNRKCLASDGMIGLNFKGETYIWIYMCVSRDHWPTEQLYFCFFFPSLQPSTLFPVYLTMLYTSDPETPSVFLYSSRKQVLHQHCKTNGYFLILKLKLS